MISASIMCADLLDLKKDIKMLEEAKVEYFHLDIMDGNFVPNFAFGTEIIKKIREITNTPLDIHLMIDKPEEKLKYFNINEGDIVSVHIEATSHINRTLRMIKENGALAGIAVNPGTALECLSAAITETDILLLMMVNPGFAGQKLIEHSLNKIISCKKYFKNNGLENIKIEVDGNVSFGNAKKMKENGADIFVSGSSSIFRKDMDIKKAVKYFRNSIA